MTIEANKEVLKELYDNYGRTTDDEINQYLSKIQLFKKVNTKYFPYTDSFIKKIKEKPRKSTFFDSEIQKKNFEGLDEWKRVIYLVKSSSRFFLKADIGEIFDQIDRADIPKIKGMAYLDDNLTLDGTDGEHFLMSVVLLYDKREKKLERILKKDSDF